MTLGDLGQVMASHATGFRPLRFDHIEVRPASADAVETCELEVLSLLFRPM